MRRTTGKPHAKRGRISVAISKIKEINTITNKREWIFD